MNNKDIERFGLVTAALAEEYDIDWTEERLSLWRELLAPYDIEDIERAAYMYMRDRDKGHFKPHASDLAGIIEGSTETQALRAWTAVEKAVHHVGPWKSVVFDDPMIHATVEELGGWVALGNVNDKEWPFKRNEFVTRYRGFCRNPPESYPRVLVGSTEAKNREAGGEIPAPEFVGNPNLALLVYREGRDGPPIQITSGVRVQKLLSSIRALSAPNDSDQEERKAR